MSTHLLSISIDLAAVSSEDRAQNSSAFGPLPAALAELQAQTPGDIWVVGGGMTARACLDGGFMDELELYVIPRLLGDGIPLFSRRENTVALELIQTQRFQNGVVMMRYRVDRR